MRKSSRVILLVVVVFVCYPIICILVGSFMDKNELVQNIAGIYGNRNTFADWSVLPQYPTLQNYIELILDTPEFFAAFWNTVCIVLGVIVGQFLVGFPAAWGFAKHDFPLKHTLWTVYLILMLLPFQAKMLSEYLVLDKLGLLNTFWAIILPAVFSTYPIFIMYHYFCSIDNELLEAAKIDGATELDIFLKIALPIGKNGIVAALVLSFFEYYNIIEQPLIFLKDKTLWPLSLFLPNISVDNAGVALSASVVTLVPAIIIFLLGEEALEKGVTAISR